MHIRRLTLYAQDISAMRDFYSKTLGFLCKAQKAELQILTQENTLIFQQRKNAVYYHFAFLIPTGCLQSAIDYLETRGIALLLHEGKKVIDFGSGRAIYFYDPAGNIVEFIERPTLGYPERSDFRIQNVLKVNEIGLPCENPMKMAQDLVAKFNIQCIDPAAIREDFCWVGDFHGVFIAIKLGRKWLPVEKVGISNDFEIEFEELGETYHLRFENNVMHFV